MGESLFHMDLVKLVYDHVNVIVPENLRCLIEVDLPNFCAPTRTVENYVPDVYFRSQELLVIGEAKTLNDFERRHSMEQYKSYLRECEMFQGRSFLVLSVPWEIFITAKNYFRNLKIIHGPNVQIIIINQMGMIEQI